MRREFLGLQAYFSTNSRTGRAELVVRGSGLDVAETRRAFEWMERVLHAPDWRPENLARLRDILDQSNAALRNTMQGAEEYWVHDPANAYWQQDRRLFAHTNSFLTRAHDVHRLRWMLEDPGEDTEDLTASLEELRLVGAQLERAELASLTKRLQEGALDAPHANDAVRDLARRARRLSPAAAQLLEKVGKDLGQLLGDIPDPALPRDWDYLCRQIRHDLLVAPAQALSDLHRVRAAIVNRGNARLFAIASHTTHTAIASDLDRLTQRLSDAALRPQAHPTEPYVLARLRERLGEVDAPIFVALVNPDTQGGVFVNTAAGHSYFDREQEDLLGYLAGNLFTGQGAHGVFMKTWAAGLAYSNGIRGSLATGRLEYYAERCPALPQTLAFAVDVLRTARRDPDLAKYAVAQSFNSRTAATYEGRGEALAADLTDGVTPDVVRAHRAGILELAGQSHFADLLFDRLESVCGRVLPGYGPPSHTVQDGVFFAIGPEEQLDAYQRYLHAVEGEGARLYRLYPRDFWIPAVTGDLRPSPDS